MFPHFSPLFTYGYHYTPFLGKIKRVRGQFWDEFIKLAPVVSGIPHFETNVRQNLKRLPHLIKIGIFAHESFHSLQEAQIEEANGEDFWTRSNVSQDVRLAAICATEVEAFDFELALPLRYSAEFVKEERQEQGLYASRLDYYGGNPFAPGSYYIPTPLDEHY